MSKSIDVKKEYMIICEMLDSGNPVHIEDIACKVGSIMPKIIDKKHPHVEHIQNDLIKLAKKLQDKGYVGSGNEGTWKNALQYLYEKRLKPLSKLINRPNAITYKHPYVTGIKGILDLYLQRDRNTRITKSGVDPIRGCLNFTLVSQMQEWLKERGHELEIEHGNSEDLPEYIISLDDSIYRSGSKEQIAEHKHLSRLVYCIINKIAVKITYRPHFLEGASDTLIFHPEYLCRNGNKWMAYGLSCSEHMGTTQYVNIVVNRIDDIEECDAEFEPSGVDYSEDPFKDQMTYHSFVVDKQRNMKLQRVLLRVKKRRLQRRYPSNTYAYPFERIKQEPLHHSQRVVEPEDARDGNQYGYITLDVKDADFISPLLLPWGSDIEVLQPERLRNKIRREIAAMYEAYMDHSDEAIKTH